MDSQEPIQLELFDSRPPAVPFRLKFRQAAEIFDKAHWSQTKMSKSLAKMVKAIIEFFGEQFLDDIHMRDLENLRVFLREKRGYGTSSVNHAHGYVKNVFNRCFEWKDAGSILGQDMRGLIVPSKNPAKMVRAYKWPTRDRAPTPFEARQIMRYCKILNDWAAVDIIRFGFWFRLSKGDLEQLSDEHVNEARFQIEIRRIHTKTRQNPLGELQTIKLTEKSWAAIQRLKRIRPPGTTRLLNFTNWRRRLLKIRQYARAQGHEDFWTGDFRTGAASELYGLGFTTDTVAKALGNTEKVAKRHYIKRENPDLRRVSEALVEATDGNTGY